MTGQPATLDELFGDDLSHQGTRNSATPERKIRRTVFGMSGRQRRMRWSRSLGLRKLVTVGDEHRPPLAHRPRHDSPADLGCVGFGPCLRVAGADRAPGSSVMSEYLGDRMTE